jgi:surfactin synthase thioesterase subunit
MTMAARVSAETSVRMEPASCDVVIPTVTTARNRLSRSVMVAATRAAAKGPPQILAATPWAGAGSSRLPCCRVWLNKCWGWSWQFTADPADASSVAALARHVALCSTRAWVGQENCRNQLEKKRTAKTVAIPPLLCSPLAYAPMLNTLWAQGQVTFADTRRDETIAGMATRILDENAGSFTVLGTSMGGYVALEVMRQAPERVTALALVSTSSRADTTEQRKARAKQSALVSAGHFSELIDAAFSGVVAAEHASDNTLRDTWRAMTTPVGPDAFLRQQQAVIERADLYSLLETITCPTAIIHGAGDRLIPLAAAEESAAALPAATFTVIEGAGHLLFHEQPDAARAALEAWLSSAGAVGNADPTRMPVRATT